jgi:Protein of unknown function (DUF3048) N-terminal domain/Protein of unknown function (DUF3048) C-terminal domain
VTGRVRGRGIALTVAVLLVGGLVAAACGGGDDSAAKETTTTSSTTTTTIPVPIAPFTGLPDPSGVSLTRSSVAVKIENTPEARPQSGLDVADVVYEEVVDGGITRFWAVFNSNAPENIGPVRSVRAMDPQIVTPLGGVVAYSGGTEPNVAAIRATGLVWVDENNAGDAFFREPTRSAPHNLFARSALLWERGGVPVPPVPLFQYVDTEQGQTFTGEPVTSFHANYELGYDVSYVWDANAGGPGVGGWLRFQRTNEPFMAAALAPVQVNATNVIVQFVPYEGFGEGNLIGTGEAWVFSNGQLVRGTWVKGFIGSITEYKDANGAPILLTPGRTWVELVPVGKTVDLVQPPAPPAPPPTVAPTTTTTKRK